MAVPFDNNQTLHDFVTFVSFKCAGAFNKILWVQPHKEEKVVFLEKVNIES